MAAAGSTDNFDSLHAVRRVDVGFQGPDKALVKSRPSATRVKFALRRVQRCLAGGTSEMTRDGFEVMVFAGPSSLGSLLSEHTVLLRCELFLPFCVSLLHGSSRERKRNEKRRGEHSKPHYSCHYPDKDATEKQVCIQSLTGTEQGYKK